MDFGIGYRWRSFESNLLLSVKLPSDGSESADTTPSAPSPNPRSPNHRVLGSRVRRPISSRPWFLLVFALS